MNAPRQHRSTLGVALARALLAVALLAVALVAVLQAASGAAAAPPAPSAVPNCIGKPTVKPAEIVLACADAGLGVRSLHWVGWGQTRAAGIGTAFANDCTPNCAAGRFRSYPAVIVLSGWQSCDGVGAYRTAQVAVVGSPPAAWRTVANATYPLRCAT